MNRRLLTRVALFAGGALLLLGLGWHAHALLLRREAMLGDRRVKLGGFRFVSPLLDVELPEGFSVSHEPIPFKFRVRELVEERIAQGKARDISVYYRDLLDGPWFGIDEKRRYDPASLMKVPVMIAWLKRAEKDPRTLQRTFVFDGRGYPGKPQTIAPGQSLVVGRRYTVDELLRHMVAYSDNKAMWLLFGALREEELGDVLDSMDVTNDPGDESNSISAHGYSGFFRILYNAAYLSREMSEKALMLLSQADFPRGIAAGVPKGVIVAAKFGEAVAIGEGGVEVQLHEFGIVYHPRGAYILGVMTSGSDWDAQVAIIRDVAALIYDELETQAQGQAERER